MTREQKAKKSNIDIVSTRSYSCLKSPMGNTTGFDSRSNFKLSHKGEDTRMRSCEGESA